MNDNTRVNAEALKQVNNKMIDGKNEIMDIYNSNIKEVIRNSEQFLDMKGIAIGDIANKINELFADFNKKMTELTDTLSDIIVPGYINLNDDIKNLFSEQFASEMDSLMNNKE